MLREGCVGGIGLTALLPPGVLVAVVLTNSCPPDANLRFRGRMVVSARSPRSSEYEGKRCGWVSFVIDVAAARFMVVRYLRNELPIRTCRGAD